MAELWRKLLTTALAFGEPVQTLRESRLEAEQTLMQEMMNNLQDGAARYAQRVRDYRTQLAQLLSSSEELLSEEDREELLKEDAELAEIFNESNFISRQ